MNKIVFVFFGTYFFSIQSISGMWLTRMKPFCETTFNKLLTAVRNNKVYEAEKILLEGNWAHHVKPAQENPIHIAARNGNDYLMQILTNYGARVHEYDPYYRMPIHIAAKHGHTKCLDTLARKGALMNAKGGDYLRTPLHFATISGHTEATDYLLKKNVNDFCQDALQKPAIAYALDKDSIFKQLIATNNVNLNIPYFEGNNTLLHESVRSRLIETVYTLLKHGANPNLLNSQGNTPLHIAAINGPQEIIEQLLHAGASLHFKNSEGLTPIDLAHNANSPFLETLQYSRNR